MHRDSEIQIKDSFLPGSGVQPQISNPFNRPLKVEEEKDEVYEEEDMIEESYHNDSQIEDNYEDGLNDHKASDQPVVMTVKDNDLSYSHHPLSTSNIASFNQPAVESAPKVDESIKDSYINQSF